MHALCWRSKKTQAYRYDLLVKNTHASFLNLALISMTIYPSIHLSIYPSIWFYHHPNVLPLPAIISTQVTTCNAIQKVLKANAFFTSVWAIGKNSGLSSSSTPIGIPTVLAHTFRNRLWPLIADFPLINLHPTHWHQNSYHTKARIYRIRPLWSVIN